MKIIRAKVVELFNGVKQWVAIAIEDKEKAMLLRDNIPIFDVFPGGDKIDLRINPPFLTILPCPYCGVSEDRNHDPLKHINKALGKLEPFELRPNITMEELKDLIGSVTPHSDIVDDHEPFDLVVRRMNNVLR
jgi:uncharacterized C2H2 Zn-finger protein